MPWYRVSYNHAFVNVALDFTGLLYYNNHTDKESRTYYILLFTCCFSRSIHLELTTYVSSETFLLALRRFISKRGCSKIIVSDHFKSFKSGELKSFVGSKGVIWDLILKHSPWWGGFYERLVAIAKIH